MNPLVVIPLLTGLTILAAVYAFYAWYAARLAGQRSLRQRLDPTAVVAAGDGRPGDILRTETLSNIASLDTLLRRFSPATYLDTRLRQAGLRMGVASVLYVMGFVTLGTTMLLQMRFDIARPLALLGGAGAGIGGTLFVISHRRKRRLQTFVAQLPAALDMIRSSLHAGHSFNYALEVAVDELSEPIAGAFRTVLEEIRLGLSPKEALENMHRAFPVPELRFFVLAVILTREVGGNLSEVLGTLSATLRDRAKLRQQCRALSAQGRASAILLFSIPPGVAFFANLIRPGFVDPLFEHPTGRLMLGVALGFQMAGFLLIQKIVNPKELGVA
jgi:tight adherence protein B